MPKRILLLSVIFLLSLGYAAAQRTDYQVSQNKQVPIDVQTPLLWGVQEVKLVSIITESNGKLDRKIQLSFLLPSSLDIAQNKTGVMLTAYNSDGSILGQQIWCSVSLNEANKKISGESQLVVLDVNPLLEKASRYTLTFADSNSSVLEMISCQECVELAKNTCGRDHVGSVSCGADGSCSFTCR